MKNILKVSLLVALFTVSTARAVDNSGLAKCLGILAVVYNIYDVGCMMNSTPYWLMRRAEAQVLRTYVNNVASSPFYSVLPTMQATIIECKLDLASFLHKEIGKIK